MSDSSAGPATTPIASPASSVSPTAHGTCGEPRLTAKPAVISHVIHDRDALYMAYMPFLQRGGVFVPCQRDAELGDEVFLLLSLPDDEQRYTVAGHVAWITPPGTTRVEGIGVHFPDDDAGKRLRARIEDLLGTMLASDQPTHTL